MPDNREELLLQKLLISKHMSVQESMDLLGVSKSTIRRIFIEMEKRGTVIRAHGGIQLTSSIGYSFDNLKKRYSDEKLRIGKSACELVEDDDIVFLDAGTTSMYFAFQLVQAITNEVVSVKSLFTNSIALLDVFPASMNISLIGGNYRPERKDLNGYLSNLAVSHLHFSKCFLGTDGVINNNAFGAMDTNTAELNMNVLKNSTKRIVLCDHSKFSSICHFSWASFNEVDIVISDTGIDNTTAERLRNHGCNVILT